MKKILTLFIAFSIILNVHGQNFEGVLIYTNSYKSKMPQISDSQWSSMMGSKQEYFIKNGDYKSLMNGSLFQWQIYINKDNKLYNKLSNSETAYWIDGSHQADKILNIEINREVKEILGHKCDEVIIKKENGTEKYYFNAKFSVDSKLFVNHKYGNWYDYLSKSNALPLLIMIDADEFTMESLVTDIQPMKLDVKIFELPIGIKTEKSPE